MLVLRKFDLAQLMEGLADDVPVIVFDGESGEFGVPTEAGIATFRKLPGVQTVRGVEFSGYVEDPKGEKCLVLNWEPRS